MSRKSAVRVVAGQSLGNRETQKQGEFFRKNLERHLKMLCRSMTGLLCRRLKETNRSS
jgi:hypothetical protein